MADDAQAQEPAEAGLAASIFERGQRYSTGILGGESGILDGMVTYRESAAITGMASPGGDVVSRTADFGNHLQSLLSHNESRSRALRVAVDQPRPRFVPLAGADSSPAAESVEETEPAEADEPETGGSWMEQLSRRLSAATESVARYEQSKIPSGPSGIDLSSVMPPPADPGDRPIRRRARIEEGPTVAASQPPGPPSSDVISVEAPPNLRRSEDREPSPPPQSSGPIQRTTDS
ncbi:MAG TPA: hypothetical protein PJ994_09445, partial [Tepidiformaceae bacterium]|nr:hypothetical protein [Tepidiformaceae bacterium]